MLGNNHLIISFSNFHLYKNLLHIDGFLTSLLNEIDEKGLSIDSLSSVEIGKVYTKLNISNLVRSNIKRDTKIDTNVSLQALAIKTLLDLANKIDNKDAITEDNFNIL